MKTKTSVKQTAEPCSECLTIEEHRDHLERKEQGVVDVQARLAWIALQRSGGVYSNPPIGERRGRPVFGRSYS